MSSNRRMGRSASKKRTGRSKRGFYDLFTRHESDRLRWRVLAELGLGYQFASASSDHSDPYDAFRFFDSLPDVTWDSPDLATTLNLLTARALFSKDEDLRSPIDKEEVAFQSFLESEESCRKVNDVFSNSSVAFGGDVECIIHYAQRKISSILGDVPSLDELNLTFGPGASTSCRKRTSARWKLSTTPSISNSALGSLKEIRATLPAWFSLHNNQAVVQYGDLEFVPKNYKTHRTICIEPSVNGMVQRGIGSVLKRKLARAGIDLSDQSINKRRAAEGSRNGDLCTIDLSRASDSIAYNLVLNLIPLPWFELLDTWRTPAVRYHKNGTVYQLEKFSSMGNGYTFELESLIFYSLAYGIARHFDLSPDITVYGDDIVVPSALFDLVVEFFPIFGFSVNRDKSFSTGRFRESCGGDYLNGVDVRPFFLRDRFTYAKIVSFYNFLMRKPWFDPDRKVRDLLLANLPPFFQLWGPDGFGDGHLISNDPNQSYLKAHGRKRGYSGYIFDTFVSVPEKVREPVIGDMILPSYLAQKIDTYVPIRIYDSKVVPVEPPSSSDPYVVRFSKNGRVKSKKVSVYVLGPA